MLPYVLGMNELVSQSALMIFADGPTVAIVMDYDATTVEGVFDEVIAYQSTWRDPLLTVCRSVIQPASRSTTTSTMTASTG